MLHIRIVLMVATTTILFCGISGGGSVQADGRIERPNRTRKLEMTEIDVFAKSNWNSEDVTILGFGLGMSRHDAEEKARKQGLMLDCVDYCDVCNGQKTLCKGIGLYFDKDNYVRSIFVVRPIAEASTTLRKFSVTEQFKGKAYQIFHQYSNALRLKLFGSEARREDDNSRGITKYFYPAQGLDVDVNLSLNKSVLENEADLIITFTYPDKAHSP
jgi:hypothetical protein